MDDNDTTSTEYKTQVHGPYIYELGKASNKQIRALKRGEGKLQEEVDDAIDEVVKKHLKESDKGKPIVPIVLIYRKRRRKSASGGGLLPFPLSPLNLLR